MTTNNGGGMSKIETGGPAFPVEDVPENYFGMTLRDYFAATALQGMLASGKTQAKITKTEIATVAYGLADAMLKAREEK